LPCSQSRAACGSVRIAADFSEQQPAASPSGQKHETPSLPARRAMTGLSYTRITPKRESAGL